MTIFKTYAQPCAVGNPIISNVATYSQGDSCYATFDLSFSLKANSGNKLVGISLWMATKYAQPTYSKVPNEAELINALGTLVINNDNASLTTQNLPLFSIYPYIKNSTNAGVKMLRSDALVTRTYSADSFYFNITNITVAAIKNAGNCPVDLLTIKGDLWSSNAGSEGPNTPIQCFSAGAISFSLGNPSITAANRNCTTPKRSMNFTIETVSTVPITVSYEIYKDDNVLNTSNELYFNPGSDTKVTLDNTPSITNLSASAPYHATNIEYIGADQISTDGTTKYWLVVYYTPTTGPTKGETYSVTRLVDNVCAIVPLPVTLKSFTAKRDKESVHLAWETAMELNNSGFDIQRKVGGGEWKTIAFMFSKADGGNSNSLLHYEYNDVNPAKGVSQYRLRQVDIDTRSTFSEVRSVRGLEQASQLLVYPNPSADGKVTIIFNERSSRSHVTVSDMAGRVVKQYKNIDDNSLLIDGLQNGIYTLHITNTATGMTTVEKVIVKKR